MNSVISYFRTDQKKMAYNNWELEIQVAIEIRSQANARLLGEKNELL